MRLDQKFAIVVGGGQQPGGTPGNGRATAIRFSQEGAVVMIVDINEEWAADTLTEIEAQGGAGRVRWRVIVYIEVLFCTVYVRGWLPARLVFCPQGCGAVFEAAQASCRMCVG